MTAATAIIRAMQEATATAEVADPLLVALRGRFGHTDFRPGQREVVETLLAGHDAVVVMPTGGGKSLCYQLPAVLGGAPTLVVSPLIALMKDQVDALRTRGIAAAALHSNLDTRTQRDVEHAYAQGALALLYVAPERLVRADLRGSLAARPPERIVVDEAHCISEWGHDFRRDYLRIGEVASTLPSPQVVACTATATPAVRGDIVQRLHMRDPQVVVRGFARPELHLSVHRVRNEAERWAAIERLLDPGEGHAIVYAGTRARAAELADRLALRFPTMVYHADLDPATRAAAQERFAAREVRVCVATSAFGMGVDVPTVRQVIHAALPSSLEEYYQQAGRAGRDGLPAACLVVHTPADRRLPEFFIDAAHPDAGVVGAVYRTLLRLGSDPGAWRNVDQADAAARGVSDAAADSARELLRDAGVITPDGRVRAMDWRDLPVDHGRVAAHRRLAYDRFARLLDFLGGTRCRHRSILDHFGETDAAVDCGDRCDVCDRSSSPPGPGLDSTTVRQALSAVARLNGRLGAARIAALLCGSRRRDVLDIIGNNTIPTHGALSHWREADAVELLRRLLDLGALRQAPPPYPTLSLTRLGMAVMRGEQTLHVPDPRRHGATPVGGDAGAARPPLDAGSQRLYQALRDWRTGIARERRVPAYIVFNDRTLEAVAARHPRSADALLAVPGVGPGKLALYGDAVLAVVAAHLEAGEVAALLDAAAAQTAPVSP